MLGKIEKNEYTKVTDTFLVGAILTYVAALLLLISFCSPFWIESYEESFSSFSNMGLWQYCFRDFQYPNYQYVKLFNGCHHVFSYEYHTIREWLLPGWLIAVQSCVTLAFIISFTALSIMALEVIRLPIKFVLQYEWLLTKICFVGVSITSALLFLASLIFGINAYRRDWLMYPKFNVLSWGYALCVVSFMMFGIAALVLYKESKKAYDRRREAKNLVMQMHETSYPPGSREHPVNFI